MNRLISKALWGWRVWRMRCQREREMPELRALRLRREACRKQHRNAKAVDKAASDALHASMAVSRPAHANMEGRGA